MKNTFLFRIFFSSPRFEQVRERWRERMEEAEAQENAPSVYDPDDAFHRRRHPVSSGKPHSEHSFPPLISGPLFPGLSFRRGEGGEIYEETPVQAIVDFYHGAVQRWLHVLACAQDLEAMKYYGR